jgi:hypothetical protein
MVRQSVSQIDHGHRHKRWSITLVTALFRLILAVDVLGGASGNPCQPCTGCEPGTFCPVNSSHAIGCPPGFYCPPMGVSVPVACPANSFCPSLSTSPQPCPVAQVSPVASTLCFFPIDSPVPPLVTCPWVSGLSAPYGIAFDRGNDTLYVTSNGNTNNGVVCKVSASGAKICPWAQGPIEYPQQLAFDASSGNIFVADNNQYVVWQITAAAAATQFMTGMSGAVIGVAVSTGNLYATSWSPGVAINQVCVLSVASGGGSPSCNGCTNCNTQLNQPYGLAAHPDNGTVYIANFANNNVCILGLAGGSGVTCPWKIAGPQGLAVESVSGTVLVSQPDSAAGQICKIAASGVVTCPWVSGFGKPWGLAVNSSSDGRFTAYVVDTHGGNICKVQSSDVLSTCSAGSYGASGSSTCDQCASGTFCPSQSIAMLLCPVCFMCPTAMMAFPVPCAAGNTCPSTGMSQGILCPVGSFCPDAGMSVALSCPGGSFCPNHGTIVPVNCSAGCFCPPGTSAKQVANVLTASVQLRVDFLVTCSS